MSKYQHDPSSQSGSSHFAQALSSPELTALSDSLQERHATISIPSGYDCACLIIRPRGKPPSELDYIDSPRIVSSRRSPKRPLIVHFPDSDLNVNNIGNTVLKNSAQSSPQSRPVMTVAHLFAHHFNATVLIPDYRHPPERQWLGLVPRQDAIAIVQAVSSNPSYHYGANLEHGFIISGFGVGGSLAAIVAALVSSRPETYPLQYPLTGVFVAEARLDFAELTENPGDWFAYNPTNSPLVSPINIPADPAEDHDLCGHPPTYLQFRTPSLRWDDNAIYEKLLASANAKTKINIILNTQEAVPNIAGDGAVTSKLGRDIETREGALTGMSWLVEQVVQEQQRQEQVD